jgi:uncharacterized OB-fold protein
MCLAANVAPEPVSGQGEVYSYTIIPATDGPGDPTVVASIVFPEQSDLRLTAMLVGVSPRDVTIGMGVEVIFEAAGDVFLPRFKART